MLLPHIFLALLVMIIWGVNFVTIKIALQQLTPLWLCFFRFLLASLPAVFFVKKPKLSLKKITLYASFMFVGQFSLLFFSIKLGMPAGLAALLLQLQAFFTILFAMIFLGEKPTKWQLIGAMISFSGIVLVGFHLDNDTSLVGFILIIIAAASWGMGNFISKTLGKVDMVPLVIWSSFICCPIYLILSLIFEGIDAFRLNFENLSITTVMAVLYIVYGSTLLGYSAWSSLLSRYPVAAVSPFTMLVPVFAMISATLVLNEPMQPWKINASLLVISGICMNVIGSRYASKKIKPIIPEAGV